MLILIQQLHYTDTELFASHNRLNSSVPWTYTYHSNEPQKQIQHNVSSIDEGKISKFRGKSWVEETELDEIDRSCFYF